MTRAALAGLLTALLLSLTSAAGTAHASTGEVCGGGLDALRADLVASQAAFTSAKDFTGLVAKVDAADAKITEGKTGDAAAKLVEVRVSLDALGSAAKPKVDPVVAQRLGAEAQGVVDCLSGLGTAA